MRGFFLLFFSVAVFSFAGSLSAAEENGLPFESDLTRLKLPPVGIGHRLELLFTLTIPETQKLNHGAPSKVTIFEKAKGEAVWMALREINLNEKLLLNGRMKFEETVKLMADDSEIAVHSTIYHCGRKDTKVPCFIQGFQGFVNRSKLSKKNSVIFKARGTVY